MKKLEDLVDTYLHKGLRNKLIETLKEKGITDEQVLAAIHSIPRHYFLDSAFDKIAYEDRAFPIASDQTISQPYTVAYQTQLLQIKKGDKVLEIGTGSMYQTTVLAALGAKVYTIERQKQLFEQTPTYLFKEQYPNIEFFFGDGFFLVSSGRTEHADTVRLGLRLLLRLRLCLRLRLYLLLLNLETGVVAWHDWKGATLSS